MGILLQISGVFAVLALSVLANDSDTKQCKFHKNDNPSDRMVARLKPMLGQSWNFEDEDYQYSIGICVAPDKLDLPPDTDNKTYTQAGAVQREKSTKSVKILGSLQNTELMVGSNWLMLEYEMGQAYRSHCGKEPRRTMIMMVCDPEDTQGTLKMMEENNDKKQDCYYLFEVSTASACSTTSGTGLNAGAIVVIVLLSVSGAYLVLGFLYQRFARGAQGKEQLPHYAFWSDVGNLAADGCDFVCRSKGRGDGARQYRGIGDDQLQTPSHADPPSDVDEHLLPM